MNNHSVAENNQHHSTDNYSLLENVELHGEQVREVLNRPPHWLLVSGSSIIFCFIVILLFLACIIKYPDILSGRITITSEVPAIGLVSKTNGRIQKLFVSDNAQVVRGQKLALIENTANSAEIEALSKFLKTVDSQFENNALSSFPNYLNLGDIQNAYSTFVRGYEALNFFKNTDAKEKQLIVYNEQLSNFQRLLKQYMIQKENLNNELNLLSRDVERSTTLFKEGVISSKELEDKQRELLRLKRQLDDVGIAEANTQISVGNIERNISELQARDNQTSDDLKIYAFESYQNLMNRISEWEQTNILKAPIDGKISYFSFWSENQYVKQGDDIFTIIPKNQSKTIGKVLLPIQNTGKLKLGQRAIIKLDNYPYTEFGILEGKVQKISSIPKQNNYAVEIGFADTLMTSTGMLISSKNEIQGNINIVTQDLRLIERIFYQLRKLFL
jgi:multidrug resistance efflux pump